MVNTGYLRLNNSVSDLKTINIIIKNETFHVRLIQIFHSTADGWSEK